MSIEERLAELTAALQENTAALKAAAGSQGSAAPATPAADQPPKRGPGRPPKNATEQPATTPPATPAADAVQAVLAQIQAKGGELNKLAGGKDKLAEAFAAIGKPSLLAITEAEKPTLFPALLKAIEGKLAEAKNPPAASAEVDLLGIG